ncbi:ferredoxin [Promethearchaeum syntrophicum]|uniref:Ferredoxin n=1 Tax=Promethearchaeum syntrophicum TaxID=2594042 RepID=A0A5B9DAF8_9ARCH|nr:ferredoxin [Candidatus Prometheoarchaeum syntrophicum]QEE16103.1 ferredoxin [Candidatus Prometheoarchaeum syntrophicum]
MQWKIEDGCMGCGICTFQCPDGLKMDNGVARIINDSSTCLVRAAEVCPRQIIHQ